MFNTILNTFKEIFISEINNLSYNFQKTNCLLWRETYFSDKRHSTYSTFPCLTLAKKGEIYVLVSS